MYIDLFIAQSNTQEFLEKNRDLSKLLSNNFDLVWTETINSNLFDTIAATGVIFAALALGIFAYQWVEYQMGERGYLDWSKIVVPTLLMLLLAKPPGQDVYLGKVLIALRDIGNGISIEFLDLLSKDLTTSLAADIAAAKTMMQLITADAIQTCAAIPEQEVRDDCFFNAERQIVKLVNQYRPGGMDPIKNPKDWLKKVVNLTLENWATRLGRESLMKIQDAQGIDYANSKWFARLFGSFGSAYQAASNFAVPILFLSIGYAFYWVLELISLLTALTSPLFLGMSLYSVRYEPIVRSLTMFFGVWLAKFSYSIIIGFTGLVMSRTDSNPVLLFPLIAGLFGPLLAFGMGTGGGLGMFSVFTGTAAFSLKNR